MKFLLLPGKFWHTHGGSIFDLSQIIIIENAKAAP